jgi:PAS domain S-box-containing protein
MVDNQQHSATEKLEHHVDDIQAALLNLLRNTPSFEHAEKLISSLVEEMKVSLEELHVSDEELRQQNEELEAVGNALETERHHYHDLFDSAPIGYLVTDQNGLIRESNRAAAQMLNIDLKHIIGKPLALFVPEKEKSDFRQQLIQVSPLVNVKSWESHLQPRGSPEVRDVLFIVSQIKQQVNHEEVSNLRWLVHDISDRKRAEAAKLAQFFRETFEYAAVGIAHISPNNEWLRVNQRLCDMLGYSREALLNLSPGAVIHPDDKIIFMQIHRQLIRGALENATLEKRYLHKSGETVWVHLTLSAVHSASEGYAYTIAIVNDITERIRLIAAEREQRALAEALRETAMTITNSLDVQEVLHHILSTISRIVPQEAASTLLVEEKGLHIVKGWGYDNRFIPPLEEALKQLCVPNSETSIFDQAAITKQPVILSDWVDHSSWENIPEIRAIRSLICVPIISQNDVIGFLELHSSTPNFFTDYDGAHLQTFAAQAAIAIQNARAHEQALQLAAHEERERLARDLHDAVTQTLFTASLISESLLRMGKKKPERILPLLERLHMLNRGAIAEMRNLLTELRPDYLLKVPLSTQLYQLADAVKSRKKMDIQVIIRDDNPLPPEVQTAFYRIAQEALNNVVKHSHANKVEIGLHNQPYNVRLYLRDDGCGFDPTQNSSGIGMGTMRERAEAIQASFEVTSTKGEGTQVMINWSPKQKG